MNTRVEKDFYFQAGMHLEGIYRINNISLTLSFLVETEDPREQAVSMERVIYFLENVVQDCVIVQATDINAVEKYKEAGMRILELPEEPFDQIVGMALLLKCNAITEGKLKATDLLLDSSLSGGVRFNIVSEVAENFFIGTHWFHKNNLSMTNAECETKESTNIVKLFDNKDWDDLGLSWKEKPKKGKK